MTALWIQTANGPYEFDRSDPTRIALDVIAKSLGNLCRWNGHIRFYSVAEHSVHIARYIMSSDQFEPSRRSKLATMALLHDASEAYLGDVTRPLKRHLSRLYEPLEQSVMHDICARFCLSPSDPDWSVVMELDERIVADEVQHLPPLPEGWSYQVDQPGLGVELQFWDPERAAREFLWCWLEAGKL